MWKEKHRQGFCQNQAAEIKGSVSSFKRTETGIWRDQYYLGAFVMEALQEALQELVCIVNSLCIFTHNPDHSCSGIWLIQRIKVFTKCGNDTLIPNLTKAELDRVIIVKPSCALCFFFSQNKPYIHSLFCSKVFRSWF